MSDVWYFYLVNWLNQKIIEQIPLLVCYSLKARLNKLLFMFNILCQISSKCLKDFAYFFPLMVGLAHFDMCHQVSSGPSILYVRHSDDQVIDRSPFCFFTFSQLWEETVHNLVEQFSFNNLQCHLSEVWPLLMCLMKFICW